MSDGAWIARLSQEDFCQALAVSPQPKYEHYGGPGLANCLQLLTGSADPQQDTLAFQLTQLAFRLLAATDGHAQNYSIFLQPGDTYVMTPLYDILSMWPYFGKGPNQYNPTAGRQGWPWRCVPRASTTASTPFTPGIGTSWP